MAGKGDHRRPSSVPKQVFDQNFEAVFGPKKLNIMSDEDRTALEELNHKQALEDSQGAHGQGA